MRTLFITEQFYRNSPLRWLFHQDLNARLWNQRAEFQFMPFGYALSQIGDVQPVRIVPGVRVQIVGVVS